MDPESGERAPYTVTVDPERLRADTHRSGDAHVRITIFGGTGSTGRLLVEDALAAGSEVTVPPAPCLDGGASGRALGGEHGPSPRDSSGGGFVVVDQGTTQRGR